MHRPVALLIPALLSLALATASNFAQGPANNLRVLSREGSRMLPTVTVNNQEYVPLEELASSFSLVLKEDRLAGGMTVTAGSRSIIVTPDQPLVSVAGRIVSLTAPPLRQGNRWLVPLDFLQRALGPLLETRMELRRPSRLLLVGDIRVPRVTVRVESNPTGATATFDVSPATGAKVSSESGRLLVNFEAEALDLQTPSSIPSQEFLQSVQPGDSPATVRLVPGSRFGVHRATTSQPDATTSRLTIELLPAGAEPPAPPAATPSAPDAPAAPAVDPLPPSSPVAAFRTIVIDPGHGGEETGARGANGALEKDITLSVARRLRTMIEGRLGLRVFLTREDDRAMSLDNRSAYANSQRADAFISIHANAALHASMKGAEVYYLSVDRSDASPTAGDEGAVLPALGGGSRSIALVPWETAQEGVLQLSSTFASLVEQSLRNRVEMSQRPVQQAPFRVLVGATMPAVLVEIGYLSNPQQEQAMTQAAYQDQVAQAVFEALVQFRARMERGGAQ